MVSRRRVIAGATAAGTAGAGAALAAACGAAGTQTGAGQSALPVTLEFLHRWEGARTEVIDKAVAAFQQT